MKKILLFFSLLIFQVNVFALDSEIVITNNILGKSVSNKAIICEDKIGDITIEKLLINSGEKGDFDYLNHEVSNMDFTTSTFWVKFKLKNTISANEFYIETARPITNIAEMYEVKDGVILNHFLNGDNYNYDNKNIKNRKILFPVNLKKNDWRDIYIKLKSDGEVLTLPLIIHEKNEFYEKDSKTQFFNGIYYGILILIVVIYFFFFLFLKNRAFLSYIFYVASIFLLQFSLDGYAYQFLFAKNAYLANHIILFSAALTIFLVLDYAKQYLDLKTKLPKSNKIFNIFQIVILVLGLLSLIPGKIYEIMYPIINGVSLLSVILILFTIFKFKKHGITICNYFTGAFTVLIIGAIVFILGNFNIIFNPIISQNALKISSGLEVVILSVSMATMYRSMQQAKEDIQKEAIHNLEEKNKLMDTMNAQLEEQVNERTKELNNQKDILEEKNTEIVSSIKYALRIQQAILPSKDHVNSIIPNSFIFYKPKDVVSGDFYFVEETTSGTTGNKLALFGAVDCTGHGVPGAFMSIVGNSYLRQSIHESHVNSTGEALEFLNQGVCKTLRQDFNKSTVRDGMDIALCALDFNNMKLYFSGAKNPLFIIRDSKLPEIMEDSRNPLVNEDNSLFLNTIKGDSHPIGAYVGETLKPFKTHTINLKKGDMIYVFSDGFADQFGGVKGKKYNIKRFKKLLLSISQQPLNEQHKIIEKEFVSWKGDLEQVDDLCVIGVKV